MNWFCIQRRHRSRRGVLLLVVMSMLTLFLMLGAAYLVTATRAREMAKAYARLTAAGGSIRTPRGHLLDSVLLQVVRGPVVTSSGSFESLLADRYGRGEDSLVGTMENILVAGPLITGNLTLEQTGAGGVVSATRPTDLIGKVITFVEPGRTATSHRILRAGVPGQTGNVPSLVYGVVLDTPPGLKPVSRGKQQSRVVINGREFANSQPLTGSGINNEAWDGFDDENLFLARVEPLAADQPPSSSQVLRASYGALITDLDADNDNDGVNDGRFMDFGVPPAVDAAGNTVRFQASVLVVDLDGRFNVNAHGSLSPALYPNSHPGWSTDPLVAGVLPSTPMGSGYGPADIQANGAVGIEAKSPVDWIAAAPRLFDSGTLTTGSTAALSENPRMMLLVGGRGADKRVDTAPGLRGRRPRGSRYSESQDTPRLAAVEGRYGERAASAWPNGTGTLGAEDRIARPGQPGDDDADSRVTDRVVNPRTSAEAAVPLSNGVPPIWWPGSADFDWSKPLGVTPNQLPLPRAVFNSPPDLHGRMKTNTISPSPDGIVPRLFFAKPDWGGSASNAGKETEDDPYELRLDTRGGRGGVLHDRDTAGTPLTPPTDAVTDNPFTPAELEAVLRPYDADSSRLAPRLAALLGSAAEAMRLRVTTDSWDTTAIVGGWPHGAAYKLYGPNGWLGKVEASAILSGTHPVTGPIDGVIGGEISRGEKFNLNRPLTSIRTGDTYTHTDPYFLQRQAYFKDLYTLMVALHGMSPEVNPAEAAQYAQWAANVVEFRDADSTMTPFEYDINPRNGWNVDGNALTNDGGEERRLIFGAERPEILITHVAVGEDGGLVVGLHRPWNARAYAANAISAHAETCDPALDSAATAAPQNVVDLGRKANRRSFEESDKKPIWRLRIQGGGATQYVRFDTATPGEGGVAECAPAAVTAAAQTPKMGGDAWLFIKGPGTPTGVSMPPVGTVQQIDVQNLAGQFRINRDVLGPIRAELQRLSDPLAEVSNTLWESNSESAVPRYVTVDAVEIAPPAPGPASVRRVNTGQFWSCDPAVLVPVNAAPSASISLMALTPGGTPNNPVWFPFLNRPFVSSAELLLVPSGNALDMLLNYTRPVYSAPGSFPGGTVVFNLMSSLLDAVHIPTRFTGIHRTFPQETGGLIAGIYNSTTPVNQLSSFREPGRVNLNTVPSDDVWNAVVAGPLRAPLATRSGAALTGRPARSLVGALALAAPPPVTPPAEPPPPTLSNLRLDTQAASGLNVDNNPFHQLYTATRLANTLTTRTNVFAIWVTLKEEVVNVPDSVRYHRAFYIVDRSIPVAYEEGKDHNVWDCVRLRREIE